jgi:hypothetical protein
MCCDRLLMTVPLHGIDQHRNQRHQALSASLIGRFPPHGQRLAHRLVVAIVAGARRLRGGDLLAKHPDRVLAVIARHAHELIEDLDPVTERRTALPLPQRLDQLPACRRADLPRHVVPLRPRNVWMRPVIATSEARRSEVHQVAAMRGAARMEEVLKPDLEQIVRRCMARNVSAQLAMGRVGAHHPPSPTHSSAGWPRACVRSPVARISGLFVDGHRVQVGHDRFGPPRQLEAALVGEQRIEEDDGTLAAPLPQAASTLSSASHHTRNPSGSSASAFTVEPNRSRCSMAGVCPLSRCETGSCRR